MKNKPMALKVILSIIYVCISIPANIFLVYYAYNQIITKIFELQPVTFIQAFALNIVLEVLRWGIKKEYSNSVSFSEFEDIFWKRMFFIGLTILTISIIKDYL